MPTSSFEIRVQPEAREQLQGLDAAIGGRVWDKIQWLGEHAELVRHQPLSANLSGFFKLRVGDYRVIYELVRERRILVIHRIGHRREIYGGS